MADSANCLPLLAYLNITAIEERRMVVHHQPHSLSPSHNTSTAGQPGPKISGPHCQIIFNHLQLRDGRVSRTRHNVYGKQDHNRPRQSPHTPSPDPVAARYLRQGTPRILWVREAELPATV